MKSVCPCVVFLGAILFCLSSLLSAQTNPVPYINLPLVPTSAAPGGSGFTLTVNGAGFVAGAQISWNSKARATQFISKTQLTATISATDIATAGTASVSVNNPGSIKVASNVAFFSITNPVTTVAFTGSVSRTFGNPEYIAVGDFNGDGKLDAAVANWSQTNSVAMLLGNGNGTFQPVSLFPAGDMVAFLTVGDFNGDGKLDLATTNNFSNTISILLGNGDGTFQSPISYSTGDSPIGIVAGDFNGDGNLDLAVTSGSGVTIFLGNGDGTFQQGPSVRLAAFEICTADFNGDGILDLAGTDLGGSVTVALGNGDGTFHLGTAYQAGDSTYTVSPVDLNHDGILDLVVGNNAGATVLIGNGDGSFGPPTTYDTSFAQENSATVADFNGDGIPDIAVANEDDDTISILLGNGDGTFQIFPSVFAGGINAQALTFGDFNNDGLMDIAIASYSNDPGGVYVALQTNGPAILFSPPQVKFPVRLLGTASSISLKMTNVGKQTLTIDKISFAGIDAADFSQTNNCGASVDTGAKCDLNITFSPTNRGTRNASLVVQDNAINRQQAVQVGGTGTWMVLSPSTLNFGDQKIETVSPVKTITLTNTGSAPVTVSQIDLKNFSDIQFTFRNQNCSTLAAGTSCTIGVQFAPTHIGSYPNVLQVMDNGGGGLQQTTLSGTGVN